ncbi:hypothetical protein BK645_08795 [Pseudomonas protegens]|uniref:hypothetical protein n=1 Tax=Pseudomonas protegens TaxID=380021 RepID=UPI0002FB3437|nr:hypothetical protein [Pseudomonas protegens]ROM29060.1 hypothetical protein BK645_08795 [Pseudomonas protegens]ROM36692.1 hypothetical protein BK646_16835 [Pseudomonas protegens]
MPIAIHAHNNTAAAQQVAIRNTAQGNNLANVNIPAQGNVVLYVLQADASADLYLICNANAAQAAQLSVVYQGHSSVVQDSDWARQWTVDGAVDGVQLDLA